MFRKKHLLSGLILSLLCLTHVYSSQKAIVIGATSGIGKGVAQLLMKDGYTVGCVGRREGRLNALKEFFGDKCVPCQIDMSSDAAIEKVRGLIDTLGGCDLLFVSISRGADMWDNAEGRVIGKGRIQDWEWQTINVDQLGAWRAIMGAREFFEKQGTGQIAVVTGSNGESGCSQGKAAYAGSKAFLKLYLEGLAHYYQHMNKKDIKITDITPDGSLEKEYASPEHQAPDAMSINSFCEQLVKAVL